MGLGHHLVPIRISNSYALGPQAQLTQLGTSAPSLCAIMAGKSGYANGSLQFLCLSALMEPDECPCCMELCFRRGCRSVEGLLQSLPPSAFYPRHQDLRGHACADVQQSWSQKAVAHHGHNAKKVLFSNTTQIPLFLAFHVLDACSLQAYACPYFQGDTVSTVLAPVLVLLGDPWSPKSGRVDEDWNIPWQLLCFRISAYTGIGHHDWLPDVFVHSWKINRWPLPDH